jgi:hypothetical protein
MPDFLTVVFFVIVVLLITIGGMILNLYLRSRGVLPERKPRW